MCEDPSLRSRLAFSLALLVFMAAISQGQENQPQTLQALSQSIEQSLTPIGSDSTTLRRRLEKRRLEQQSQVEAWKTIESALRTEIETERKKSAEESKRSTELSDQLKAVQSELSASQADLTATLKSLEELKANSAQLSTGFDDYKQTAEAEIKKNRLEIWTLRAVSIIGYLALAASMVL